MSYQPLHFVQNVARNYQRAQIRGGTDQLAMILQSVAIGCVRYIAISVAWKNLQDAIRWPVFHHMSLRCGGPIWRGKWRISFFDFQTF